MVYSQEFVGGGSHVNQIRLAFVALAVKELIDRLVLRRFLEVCADDLKVSVKYKWTKSPFCGSQAGSWKKAW